MIPTYIFNIEQLEQAMNACKNHIEALQISNFTDDEKVNLKSIYENLELVYKNRLNDLYALSVAKEIKTTYELVSNE